MKLFDRTSSGLRLTAAGQDFYLKVRDIVQDLESVLARTKDSSQLDEIRVEMSDDTFYGDLGRKMYDFCRTANRYRLSIALEYSSKIIENVVLRRADIGVVVSPVLSPYSEIESFSLPPVPLFALVSSNHPLASNEEVFIDQLPPDDVVLTHVDRHCGFIVKLRSLGYVVEDWAQTVKVWPTQLSIEVIKSGKGVTILSAEAVPCGIIGIKLLKILDDSANLRRSVIWRAGCSKATITLINHLRDITGLHEPPQSVLA